MRCESVCCIARCISETYRRNEGRFLCSYARISPTRYRYTTAAGTAIKVLSKRSSIPPCPGRILLESLMPRVRFISDSVRSPHVPNTTTVSPSPIHTPVLRNVKKCAKTMAAMMLNTAPPIEPSHDFFGKYVRTDGVFQTACRYSKHPYRLPS